MKTLKSNRGSALLWTVMVLGVLMVLCTAVLTMAMSYSKRTINQNQDQQAYFTALSVVNMVTKQFSGEFAQNSPQQKVFDKLMNNPDKPIVISDMKLPPEMGTVKVTLTTRPRTSGGGELIVDDIIITAHAEKNGESYRLSAILRGDVREADHDIDYGGDGTPGIGAGSITGGMGMTTDPDTDFNVWNKGKFIIDTNGNARDSIHMGALYTNGPVEVSCSKWGYTHLHGEIIGTDNISISENATVGLLPQEFLPLKLAGKQCCDNTDISFIHTTGEVYMKDRSRMGGSVTANSLKLEGGAAICGDLSVNTATISCNWNDAPTNNYSIKGNISANNITIDKDSVVIGDITAQTVILNGAVKIDGDITAKTVEISNGATVTGNVTAESLTMKDYRPKVIGDVTANLVEMRDGAVIDGDITTGTIFLNSSVYDKPIGGKLYYYYSQNTLDYLKSKAKNSTDVNKLAQELPPPTVLPPETLPPITSTLPPKPLPPPIPKPPENPPPQDISGGSVTVGHADHDTYYIVKNGMNISHLNVNGDKNIFIFLPDSYELNVKRISDDTPLQPNVFFILGRGSELTLGGDNGQGNSATFPAYVWSHEGFGAELDMDPGSSIVGGIWVDEVEGDGNNEYHWMPPNLSTEPPDPDSSDGSDGSGEPEEPEVWINWGLQSYENR